MNSVPWQRRLSLAAFGIASGLGAGAAWAYTAPNSTPPGVTLVEVVKLMDAGSPQLLWRRLGDAHGNPLYTYDADGSGRSSCYDACAKEFPPFVAAAHARAYGDWSIIVRDDHVRQWAYQGKPLYRYSGADPIGEPQGARFQLIENPTWHDPASNVYSPKRGWRRAAYMPEKTMLMPTSVELVALGVADGFGFVDAATRGTIYAVPLSHALSSDWQPVRAAALAVPVGDFSIVLRKDDRTRQWAYRGEALYTYTGDYAPGDVNGIFTGDRSIQAALAYRNFTPAGIAIGNYTGRGPLMVTSKGQTLYFVARFHADYGGREAPGGYSVSYNEIKSQGALGCQGDCTATWRPILASANAQAQGFWELISRPEGKQWAFKGGPIYSYVGDRKPGDIEGNNRHVIVFGGPHGEIVYADAGADPSTPHLHLGPITMAGAVGAKPGENASYLAGAGYVGAEADRNDTPVAPTGQDQALARRRGLPDAGAGFYWHTIPLFMSAAVP